MVDLMKHSETITVKSSSRSSFENRQLFSRIRFLNGIRMHMEPIRTAKHENVHREVSDIRSQNGQCRAPKPPFRPTLMIRAYLDYSTPNGVLGLLGTKHRRSCPMAQGLVPIPSCKPARSVLNVREPRPFNVLPRTNHKQGAIFPGFRIYSRQLAERKDPTTKSQAAMSLSSQFIRD